MKLIYIFIIIQFLLFSSKVLSFSSKPKSNDLEKLDSNKVNNSSNTLVREISRDRAPFQQMSFSKIIEDQSYQKFIKDNSKIDEAFKKINNENLNNQKNQDRYTDALKLIHEWSPADPILNDYKSFFISTWSKDNQKIYELYQKLKKEKKYIRLRMQLLISLLKENLDQLQFKNAEAFLKNESRIVLRSLRGSAEGEEFESIYLSWLKTNQFFEEICKTEKNRWISETSVDFVELTAVIDKCPLKYDEFTLRLRQLIFAAQDYQALREIELYAAQFKIKNWEKAYAQAIFDSHAGDPIKAFKNLVPFENEILETDYKDNYFYIAQRAGELDKAEKIIEKILQKSISNSEKNEMRFQQGFLFYQNKKYKQAYKIFDELYNQHYFLKKISNKRYNKYTKTPNDFDQIAWLRGWTLYLDGQYEKSLAALEQTVSFVKDQARLAYWVADIKLKLQQESEAFAGFKKLASPVLNQKSFSYYNFLAWLKYEQLKSNYDKNDVLKNLALMAKKNSGQYPLASDNLSYSEIMQSYSFYEKDDFETDEGDIQVVNSENEIIENPELSGIQLASQEKLVDQINWSKFLILHNQTDLARWHLYEIEKKIRSQDQAESLALFYISQNFYYRALSLMNRFSRSQLQTLSLKADPIKWGALYPEAYSDFIKIYSQKRDIDPYLILSIMRAETQFKSDAISPVGAVGLMQFMPYSAQKIADLTNQQIKTNELFSPEKSIEFGASYLKKLSVEMDNQKPLIAASYNGGPHRVKSWIKNFGDIEFDKFIEHIPFNETRTYVKRVLTFGAIYDKLYNKSFVTQKYNYLLNKISVQIKEPDSLKEEWEPYRKSLK